MTDTTTPADNTTDVPPAAETEVPATVEETTETVTTETPEHHAMTGKVEDAYNITMNTLYLSGFSFILGVLFTVLILLILDFMRRNSNQEK